MLDLLSAVVGMALILIVFSDVFRSLLVPRANARALRLGPVLTLALFPAWHALSDRMRSRKLQQTMRAGLAPLMLVLSLVIWAALLIIGFGLIFWGDRRSFTPSFVYPSDAIYAAGSVFCTLGEPGHVAGGVGRLATVACSLGGLALVTVVATFLISIQGGFGRRETLVLRLESHVTLPPAGIAILETYAREDIVPRLAAFFDAWEEWAAEVAISHRAFPILMFFRSNDSRCEWLAAVGAVLDAAALIDTAAEKVPAGVSAGAHFLLRTGSRMLRHMADQFEVMIYPAPDMVDRERFRAHRARLAKAGYALVEDEEKAFLAFVERRETFAPTLGALARRLRIAVDERRAGEDDSTPKD